MVMEQGMFSVCQRQKQLRQFQWLLSFGWGFLLQVLSQGVSYQFLVV